jgi:hypothetical protein
VSSGSYGEELAQEVEETARGTGIPVTTFQ